MERTLARLLPRATRAALINYPNHHNAGDPALYLGTLRTLRRIGVRVTYRCQHSTYSAKSLAGELKRGTDVILINGGGNLGDQYGQQVSRERVLADFPDVPTVQLAQSVWFASGANLERFARLVSAHRNLILLLRDRASYELAERYFQAPSVLCPDHVLGLGQLARPRPPLRDVVWLRRIDREAAGPRRREGSRDGIKPVDWLDASPEEAVGGSAGVWLLRANRWLSQRVGSTPALWRPLAHTFVPLARRRLNYGSSVLASGRVVVTDRLHGVLLSLLMGIPVIAVDNRTQKVSSFIATWLQGVPLVQLAPSHEAALSAARDVASADSE